MATQAIERTTARRTPARASRTGRALSGFAASYLSPMDFERQALAA